MPWGQPKFNSSASEPAVFRAADDVLPDFAFGFDHQRCDDQMFRETFFNFVYLAEIRFDGAIADEFDVVQAHHSYAIQIDGTVARGSISNRIANRFPDRATPTRLERAHDLATGVGGRPGGEPERVRRL
jgi:hypothetical protein